MIDNYEKLVGIEKILRDIAYGKRRCMSQEELINELLKDVSMFNSKPDIVYRLGEIELDNNAIKSIIKVIDTIILESEKVPSKDKNKIDSYLKHLIRLLPSKIGIKYALKFTMHKRKNRRMIGLMYLKRQNYTNIEMNMLIERYKETSDQIFLEFVARNFEDEILTDKDITYILDNIVKDYWRCRIIENLMMSRPNSKYLRSILNKYPFASFYAMGRTGDSRFLKDLEKYIDNYLENYDALGLVIWSLGKIGAKENLFKIERKLLKEHATLYQELDNIK